MSLYINEIIKSIKNNKESWFMFDNGQGLKHNKLNIEILQSGNTPILSIIKVFIDNKEPQITYFDKFKLELAVIWWHKNISLVKMLK